MTTQRFDFGDRVRHTHRPEWGIGAIVRVEELPQNGTPGQRLSIRFPSVGVKTLCTPQVKLERVEATSEKVETSDVSDVATWGQIPEEDWLAPVAQRKIEEAMTRIPEAARDPFRPHEQRLTYMLDLYRFDRSGRSLIDWAVAQTSLDDPLSRFTRQELEQFFERWCTARDTHLARLLAEDGDPATVTKLMAKAPRAARDVARRRTAVR